MRFRNSCSHSVPTCYFRHSRNSLAPESCCRLFVCGGRGRTFRKTLGIRGLLFDYRSLVSSKESFSSDEERRVVHTLKIPSSRWRRDGHSRSRFPSRKTSSHRRVLSFRRCVVSAGRFIRRSVALTRSTFRDSLVRRRHSGRRPMIRQIAPFPSVVFLQTGNVPEENSSDAAPLLLLSFPLLRAKCPA